MSNAKAIKSEIVNAGRKALAEQLLAMLDAGECWFAIPHVARSGMSRDVRLSYCVIDQSGKPTIKAVWPTIEDRTETDIVKRSGMSWGAILDVIAKDWGFSWEKRCFKVGGCGFDAVHHVLTNLASLAFPDDSDEHKVLRKRISHLSRCDLL